MRERDLASFPFTILFHIPLQIVIIKVMNFVRTRLITGQNNNFINHHLLGVFVFFFFTPMWCVRHPSINVTFTASYTFSKFIWREKGTQFLTNSQFSAIFSLIISTETMLVKIHDGNVLGGPLWFTLSLLMCQPINNMWKWIHFTHIAQKYSKYLAESRFGFSTEDERQGNNSVYFFASLFPSDLLYLDEKNKKAALSFVSAILPQINLVLVRRGQVERRMDVADSTPLIRHVLKSGRWPKWTQKGIYKIPVVRE